RPRDAQPPTMATWRRLGSLGKVWEPGVVSARANRRASPGASLPRICTWALPGAWKDGTPRLGQVRGLRQDFRELPRREMVFVPKARGRLSQSFRRLQVRVST